MDSIQKRVDRGAALLDEKRPGWWERIDLDRLQLNSSCGCILGQLDGNFYMSNAIPLQPEGNFFFRPKAAENGFNAEFSGEYKPLEVAWRTLILSRRATHPVSLPPAKPQSVELALSLAK